MAKLSFMKTSGGNWRVRRYENESDNNAGMFTEEYHLTTAQWKAILDDVGVAASIAAGTANLESASQAAIQSGKLAPTAFS